MRCGELMPPAGGVVAGVLSMQKTFPLVLTALLVLAASAEAREPWAPLAVNAAATSVAFVGVVVVSWVPGAQLADEYKVYGVSGTELVLVALAAGTSATVPPGYPGYAVSGVLDGVESEAVNALTIPCATLDLDPPPGVAAGNCGMVAPAKATVREGDGIGIE